MKLYLSIKCLFLDVVGPITHQAVHCVLAKISIQCLYYIDFYLHEIFVHHRYKAVKPIYMLLVWDMKHT